MGTISGEPGSPSTCFTCTRLNPTTFLIVEDDIFGEQPFIYAKIFPTVLVLFDTGCGGASRDPDVELRSLRTFLETYPVAENEGRPLNAGGERAYAVICTHCHYDHIGGIEQFTSAPNATIWASANDKSFIQDDLPTSSLCRFLGIDTPKYTVTNWARDGEAMALPHGGDLGLIAYHTPGHTPDELAIYDPAERVLFVGDSLYEWAPIIFPPGAGDLRDYQASLFKLRDLVKGWNEDDGARDGERVKMACGHITQAADAEEFLGEVERFLSQVQRGLVQGRDGGDARGVKLVVFEREDGRVSFLGPKELFDAFMATGCPV